MSNDTTAPALTIGIDLGDQTSEMCVLDRDARIVARRRMQTTKDGFAKAMAPYGPARVVVEVGTHSPWVSRWLEAQGHEAIVANARAVRSISQSDSKTDRNDAEQLARLGRADVKLLHPIRHRSETAQRHQALLAVRDRLVKSRTAAVVQARGLAKSFGERLARCTPEAFARRVRAEGQATLFPGLLTLVELVEVLNAKISALDHEIHEVSRTHYPQTAQLRQVPGVGPITALAYVLLIDDPKRFRSSRAVGPYLGLGRRLRNSGESTPQLGISKSGDGELRRLLVQCAHHILTLGPDSDLKRFGRRILARGGSAPRKRAAVAVARKLAVLLHRLWITGEVYQPLHEA